MFGRNRYLCHLNRDDDDGDGRGQRQGRWAAQYQGPAGASTQILSPTKNCPTKLSGNNFHCFMKIQAFLQHQALLKNGF